MKKKIYGNKIEEREKVSQPKKRKMKNSTKEIMGMKKKKRNRRKENRREKEKRGKVKRKKIRKM